MWITSGDFSFTAHCKKNFFSPLSGVLFFTKTSYLRKKKGPPGLFWLLGPKKSKKKKQKNKKNRKKKSIKKNFFFAKNPKFLMGSIFFLSPIGAYLVPQNAVLWLFRGEKRKSRRKIALGGHFGGFWGILEKLIFFRFWGPKSS